MHAEFSTTALINGFNHIRIKAPVLQEKAKPGQFIIIDEQFSCYVMGNTPDLEMIASPKLSTYLKGKQNIHLSGLKGDALEPPLASSFYLITAQDDALSATIFYLKKYRKRFQGLVLLGAQSVFPFAPCPSRLLIPQLPSDVIASLPLFEDWGMPNRLACLIDAPGVYHGAVEALAQMWLAKANSSTIQEINLPAL